MRRRVWLRAARADGEHLSIGAAANLRIPSRTLPDTTLKSTTRPTVRLAAFAALLADEHKPDVVIGMYMTGRTRLPLQGIFGDSSNLTTLRLRFDPAKSFVEWLALVRDQVWRHCWRQAPNRYQPSGPLLIIR